MIEDQSERLRMCQQGRELTINISHADENRLRAFIDRMNMDEARYRTITPQDVDDDHVIESALLACVDAGLCEDEESHGLEAFPWGDMVSIEVAREEQRRASR